MMKDIVSANIQALMDERGMTRYQLAQLCSNITPQTIYNAVDGNKGSNIETLDIISRGLEVPIQRLFVKDIDLEINLTNNERLLIEASRKLSEKKQERLIGYALSLAESDSK